MNDASRHWTQLTLLDLVSATSSPASLDGASRYASQVSPTTRVSGPDPVPASRSATPGAAPDSTTTATSGLPGSDSSANADPDSSLESRLRALLDSSGSTLFTLTWKVRATPSGRPICALRALALRTGGSGCSSWPTPVASRGDYSHRNGNPDERTLKLSGVAKLSAWPTPTVADGTAGRDTFHHGENNPTLLGAARRAAWSTPTRTQAGGPPEAFLARKAKLGGRCGVTITDLGLQAQMAAWPTPRAVDGAKGSTADKPERSEGPDLPTVAGRAPAPPPGQTAIGSLAPTEPRGQLNPEHVRWLMGYPPEWASCAPTVTRSSRK